MHTWKIWNGATRAESIVEADKVILADSGVLMFFSEDEDGLILVRAFAPNSWHDVMLIA